MPTAIDLPSRIQKLLEDRQHHVDALARVDKILADINAALGATTAKTSAAKAAPAPAATAQSSTGKKRKLKRFGVSAEQLTLAFVKQHKNPTSQEIGKHWQAEGRSGRADNTLSLMVKNKKLKRTPLGKGIRGSRYSLA